MPRGAKLDVPNASQHVMAGGKEGREIFQDTFIHNFVDNVEQISTILVKRVILPLQISFPLPAKYSGAPEIPDFENYSPDAQNFSTFYWSHQRAIVILFDRAEFFLYKQ